MRKILIILICLFTCACTTSPGTHSQANSLNLEAESDKVSFSGGDGTSKQTAVIIQGAKTELIGVNAESKWLQKNKPLWRKKRQALINDENRVYDSIGLINTAGDEINIWFDISEFFGNF